MSKTEPVHVVVGVIYNKQGQVLLTQRPRHVHQAGKWEFPGGKVESNEDVVTALTRELDEELGIKPLQRRPLIRIHHRYEEKDVLLDVWAIDDYAGSDYSRVSKGREGQPVRWSMVNTLNPAEFPAANRAIISAVQLPSRYLITPEPGEDLVLFLSQLQSALDAGVRLVRLRAWSLSSPQYMALVRQVVELCRVYQARVMLSGDVSVISRALHDGVGDGIHLSRRQLLALVMRSDMPSGWLAASCHNAAEMAKAQALGVDFVVLSPVLPTLTHPDTQALGWSHFQEIVDQANLPVFALGGLSAADLSSAWQAGGQGVAAIRGLWGQR